MNSDEKISLTLMLVFINLFTIIIKEDYVVGLVALVMYLASFVAFLLSGERDNKNV